jgi:hypothetical protein
VGADFRLPLLVKTEERVDMRSNPEAARRTLRDSFEDDLIRLGREPVEEIGLLFLCEFGESAIFSHTD